MRNSLPASLAVLAALAVAAGCGGATQLAGPAVAPSSSPIPAVACTSPPGMQLALSFPDPQQTNNPATQPYSQGYGVYVAVAPTSLPTNWYAYVEPISGSFVQTPAPGTTFVPAGADASYAGGYLLPYGATPVPSPLPSGSQSTPSPSPAPSLTPLPTPFYDPGYADETFEVSQFGIFAPGATWQVYVANTNCYPGLLLGSFSS